MAEKEKEEKKPNLIVRYTITKGKNFKISIMIFFLLIASTAFLGTAYFCWLDWLPKLWDWGFNPTTWKGFVAFYGAIFLVFGPFISFSFFEDIITGIYESIVNENEKILNLKLRDVEEKQKDYFNKIEEHDKEGLISLITYSKLELEQYYKIGLNQTQKSYRYSIISMWIGFLIIMFGILSYILPIQGINSDLLNGNFNIIIIGSGVTIELISALFLWIYKNSVGQLRYFYNRQIFIHNSLFAYKISESMTDSDSSKKIIIEKILEFGLSNKDKLLATMHIKNS